MLLLKADEKNPGLADEKFRSLKLKKIRGTVKSALKNASF